MALLRNQTNGEFYPLAAYHTIGRASSNRLRIDAPYVSADHASLRWRQDGWEVCDLASRNGTFLNGQRLATGARARVARGHSLAFGDQNPTFVLVDESAPGLMAVCQETGTVAREDDGVLVLPSVERPGVLIDLRDGTWTMERDGETAPFDDEEDVTLEGQRWRVSLPSDLVSTTVARGREVSLREVRFRFRVSRDEETVELALIDGERVIDLGARVFYYLLLVLARARARGEPDGGWVDRDDLAKMLGLSREQLALQLFRARRAVVGANVRDGRSVVEDRPDRALRFGAADFEETSL